MDDRRRTLAAITIIIGFLVLVVVLVGAIVSGRKIVSPIPDDNAIKIIFVTPTLPVGPSGQASLSSTPSSSIPVTPTKKPTPKPTPTPVSLNQGPAATATPTVTQ